MKGIWWQKFLNNPYQYLLYSLLALLIFSPCINLNSLLYSLILKTVFLIIVFSIIATFKISKRDRIAFIFIAILAFVLNTFSGNSDNKYSIILQWSGQLINFLFMFFAVLLIVKKIFQEHQIKGDTLRGGISVYLMLGIMWYQMYTLIYSVDSDAFSRLVTSHQLLYFSFVTLTTVGYGDIIPINPVVMSLANLEAIIGQLYPAIIIARLVSLYSSSNLK
ncbi:transporter [Aphanothece hegewaldii CCALA 016]|uniref:Transporter n=1 Tax=Aphanothece hegewaldii CCALA 016 TaxID=2107694 RepID=A0A2T1LU78_9CHRO|nr:potassium channel family protein [Aphanothece hegewaldii]PSF35007.1 transporter [Aphanothece hegewaldii CCALA 016]